MEAKKFIRMKCPKCKARIYVDRGMKHWYCGHCGFQIEIREKPVNTAEAATDTGAKINETPLKDISEPIITAPSENTAETAANEIRPSEEEIITPSAEETPVVPAEKTDEPAEPEEKPAEDIAADETEASADKEEKSSKEDKSAVNDIPVRAISRPQDTPVPVMTDEDRARMYASPTEYPEHSTESAPEYSDGSDNALPDETASDPETVEEFTINDGVLIRYNGKSVNVTIPDSVISIGSGAFKDNQNIRNVTIPDTVTEIADSVFDGCTELTSVTLPSGLKKIRYKTFNECSNLTSITIPASVTDIMNNAMCCGLKEIRFMSNSTTWETENEFTNGSFEIDRKGNGSGVETIVFNDVRYSAAELYRCRSVANYLISNERCQHCGGKFGLFNKCKNCGKKKDY